MAASRSPARKSSFEPVYLGPSFAQDRHQLYVEQLISLLSDPKVRNIALTGAYGTGKSSVIRGLVENRAVQKAHRPVIISLASFSNVSSCGGSNEADSLNDLQREILKQLLYFESPAKLKKSRFRGIVVLPAWRRWVNATLFAIFLSLFILIVSNPSALNTWIANGSPSFSWAASGRLAALIVALTLAARLADWALIEKPRVKGFTLGPGRLELGSGEESYFDKYLAEIIYLFRVSKIDLVIFEDLDRLNHAEIFDSLREVNLQVNSALQNQQGSMFTCKNSAQPVRFIYAIRDSIFDENASDSRYPAACNSKEPSAIDVDTTQQSSAMIGGLSGFMSSESNRVLPAENRVKFFDAIIPIVPFSTHQNAYEFLYKALRTNGIDHDFNRTLLSIIGRSIVDHRLLQQIVYEFKIFANSILPGTSNDKLLALLAYKNVHLADFELIARGESQLDKLAESFHRHTAEIQVAIAEKVSNLERNSAENHLVDASLNSLRQALLDYLQQENQSINSTNFDNGQLFLGNEVYSLNPEEHRTFWLRLLTSSHEEWPQKIVYKPPFAIHAISVNSVFLKTLLEQNSLSQAAIEKLSNSANEEVTALREFANESRRGSIADLLTAAEAAGNWPDIQLASDSSKKLIGQYAPSEMGKSLIEAGFIDTDFYLYSAAFERGLNTPDAQLFLVNQIERISPNAYLRLDADSSHELVGRLCEPRFASLAGAFNGDLLLAVAEAEMDGSATPLLDRIMRDTAAEGFSNQIVAQLAHAVCLSAAGGRNGSSACPERSTAGLVLRKVGQFFPDALSDDLYSLCDPQLLEYAVDMIIRGIKDEHPVFGEAMADYLRANHCSLPVLCAADHDASDVEQAVRNLKAVGGIYSNLDGLNLPAQRELSQHGMIEVSSSNLRIATRVLKIGISLSELANCPPLLLRVVRNPLGYIEALDDLNGYSVRQDDNFFENILTTVCDQIGIEDDPTDEQAASLTSLLRKAEPGIRLKDIRTLDSRSHLGLLKAGLVDPTVSNLIVYCESPGEVPQELVTLLSHEGIKKGHDSDLESDSSDDNRRLLLRLINLSNWKGTEQAKFETVSVLSQNVEPLAWDEIADLTAERVSLSLSEGLVPDSPDSLEALNEFNDVNLTIAFLKETQMGPDLLPAASFAALPVDILLSAEEIDPEIRAEIIYWVATGLFDEGLKASDMVQVLSFTDAEGIPLDAQFVLRIAQFPLAGVDHREVERLLVRAVMRLPDEQRDGQYLRSFLLALGGDFGALLEPTGGWRDFEDFDNLKHFLLEVRNHVPSVSKVIDRGEGTIRVTRRKQ